MTELEIYLKPLTDKNAQLLTGGIFYCRDSGYLSVSASNKLSCNLTRSVLRNRQQKHTAKTLATSGGKKIATSCKLNFYLTEN
jgi:hypothetical protein